MLLMVGSGKECTSGFMQVVGRIHSLVVGWLRKIHTFLMAVGQESGSFAASRSSQPFLVPALFLPLQSSERSSPFHPSNLPSLISLTDQSSSLVYKVPCNYSRPLRLNNQKQKISGDIFIILSIISHNDYSLLMESILNKLSINIGCF